MAPITRSQVAKPSVVVPQHNSNTITRSQAAKAKPSVLAPQNDSNRIRKTKSPSPVVVATNLERIRATVIERDTDSEADGSLCALRESILKRGKSITIQTSLNRSLIFSRAERRGRASISHSLQDQNRSWTYQSSIAHMHQESVSRTMLRQLESTEKDKKGPRSFEACRQQHQQPSYHYIFGRDRRIIDAPTLRRNEKDSSGT